MTTAKLAVHPAEFWAASETIQKINKRKLCLAAARGDCDGKIVEAHTIPRGQLQRIAIDGHVYHIRGTLSDLLANDGQFTVGKRGIGQFSVLNFFCAKHDQNLFSHIENDELVFDREQLALLHYRAMGAELYKKMNALEGSRHHVKRLQERNDRGNLEFAKAFEAGSTLGLSDIVRTFSQCEALLNAHDYWRVNGVVVLFKKMPSIMTVGGFSPEFDYDGHSLQKLGQVQATYEQIGLSILASQERAAVVFTWLAGADICHKFARSFVTKNSNLFSTLAIQTSFEHLENTCMNINWWDSLPQIERKNLLQRMQLAGSPTEERTGVCLQYCGVTFDQWEYDSHIFVGCN